MFLRVPSYTLVTIFICTREVKPDNGENCRLLTYVFRINSIIQNLQQWGWALVRCTGGSTTVYYSLGGM